MRCLLFLIVIAFFSMCTNNSEEELYKDVDPSCDTTNVSFSNDVFPIIENNCISCHGTDNPPLGIVLNNYSAIRDVAESGRLLGAIRHESGYTPMPQNAPKLEECKIAAIEAWINRGMPDN
jgi:cytochrome c553